MSKDVIEDFLKWDISTLSKAYSQQKLSPLEVTKKLLDRIQSVDKELNTYITVEEESALTAAKIAEQEIHSGNIKGKLHGVPIALKDNIFTKGIRTTNGSEIYQSFKPEYNATVVENLKKEGAIILGKLNMHQFAYGTTGDRSFFGPVRNSHDLSKIPGGSSSGSATALASYLCYATLGTDTGGSIRIPSSFEGIVGMKPTFGRVSKFGVFPVCYTMDHIGPMTRTVRDNAILLSYLAGFDPRDSYSKQKESEDFTRDIEKSIQEAVLGIPTNYYFDYVDDEVKWVFEQVVEKFKDLGAQIKYIELPNMEDVSEAFWTTLKGEAYALHEESLQKNPDSWDDEVRVKFYTGESVTVLDYLKAQAKREEATKAFRMALSKVDVILTPTVPILPVEVEQREVMKNNTNIPVGFLLNYCTGPTNLIGLPSLSISAGLSNTGLPIGIQLIGDIYTEANLYKFASAFELNS